MATAAARGRMLQLPDHLPALSGRVLVCYRILWCLLAVLALASLALAYRLEVSGQLRGRAVYDLGLISRGPGRLYQPFSTEAKGLLDDRETLLAIDGHEFPADADRQAEFFSGLDGSSANVEFLRADGTRHRVVLTRSRSYLDEAYSQAGFSWEFRRWTEWAVVFLAKLCALVVGLLLYLRRPRDPVAALIATAFAIGVIDPYSIWPSRPEVLGLVLRCIQNSTFFLGILAFPDGKLRSLWVRFAALLVVPATIAMVLLNNSAVRFENLLGLALTASLLIALIAALASRYRTSSAIARQQIKLAVYGLMVGMTLVLLGALLAVVSFEVMTESTRAWLILGQYLGAGLGVLIMSAGLLLALLRYRLFDTEAAISRSAVFGALTIALLGIFAGSEKLVEVMGEEFFGESLGRLAGGIGAGVAAIMLVPLHHRLTRWAEHRFQKQLMEMKRGLPLLMGDLRETASLDRTAAAALDAVMRGVRSKHVAILAGGAFLGARGIDVAEVARWREGWISSTHDGRDSDETDPLFPLRVPLEAEGHGRVGWLLLGPRLDGIFYSSQECAALAEVSDSIARAIEIVRVREENRALGISAIATLESKLEALREEMFRLLNPRPLPAVD